MEVKDTKLTVPARGICHVHAHTREQPRLSDGHRHPILVYRLNSEGQGKLVRRTA